MLKRRCFIWIQKGMHRAGLRSGALEGDGLELAARFGLAALENGEDPCL